MLGFADGTEDPGFQIFAAADKVQYFASDRIHQETVNCEIPALYVFPWILAEANFVGMTAIGVADIGAEGCYLDDGNFLIRAYRRRAGVVLRKRHQDYAKLRAYSESLREDFHYLLRSGIGGNVVVSGLAMQQQIAHASADEVGLVAALTQDADDGSGVLVGVGH